MTTVYIQISAEKSAIEVRYLVNKFGNLMVNSVAANQGEL